MAMAACRKGSIVSPFASQLLRSFRCHSRNKVYSRRAKEEKRESQPSIDIEGILRGPAKPAPAPQITSSSTPTESSSNNSAIRKWQRSSERTHLLRKSERTVAIIAVVTMLIGFVAIKLMVYVAEKRRAHGTTTSETVQGKPS